MKNSNSSLVDKVKSFYAGNQEKSELKWFAFVYLAGLVLFSFFDFVIAAESQRPWFIFGRLIGISGAAFSFVFASSMSNNSRRTLINSSLFLTCLIWSVTNNLIPDAVYYSNLVYTQIAILFGVVLFNYFNRLLYVSLGLLGAAFISISYGEAFSYFFALDLFAIAMLFSFGLNKIVKQKLETQFKLNWLIDVLEHDVSNQLLGAKLITSSLKMEKNADKIPESLDSVLDTISNIEGIIKNVKYRRSGLMDINTGILTSKFVKLVELKDLINSYVAPLTYTKNNVFEIILPKKDEMKTTVVNTEFLLNSVMGNILSNSIKYSPEGTKITIHLSMPNDKLVILVSDESGTEIQLDANGRPVPFQFKNSGTGTGFHIMEDFLTEIGGSIDYHPSPSGTTVELKF